MVRLLIVKMAVPMWLWKDAAETVRPITTLHSPLLSTLLCFHALIYNLHSSACVYCSYEYATWKCDYTNLCSWTLAVKKNCDGDRSEFLIWNTCLKLSNREQIYQPHANGIYLGGERKCNPRTSARLAEPTLSVAVGLMLLKKKRHLNLNVRLSSCSVYRSAIVVVYLPDLILNVNNIVEMSSNLKAAI